MKKLKVAILGTGNIGTDLLIKITRSRFLECTMFSGRRADSKGIAKAKELGIPTSIESIDAIANNPSCCDIIFDTTSAKTHIKNKPIFKMLGKLVLDLTPSRTGKMCVPIINMEECLKELDVNFITCGGQATIPIVRAVLDVQKNVEYVETVSTIASLSAGHATRVNIDEFTQTTREALSYFSEVEDTKAIILLNPASPPITMRNTIYFTIKNPNMDAIKNSVNKMAREIQQYVPGYKIILEPTYNGENQVTIMVEVLGSGDYLPVYSGNLDIITCAAIKVAEEYAQRYVR